MNQNLIPSQACINIIKHFEGLHKVLPDGMVEAYLCPANVWTIGYGHTKGVFKGQKITKQECEDLLREDLIEFADYVKEQITAPLTQAQFDALVSFTYNLGPGNLKISSLRRKLNAKDYDGAAAEFANWNKARVNGQLVALPGLTRRRTAEAALFSMDAPVGQDDVVLPQAVEEQGVKPLTHSKTMAGAGIAGIGVTLTEVANQIQPVSEVSPWIKQVFIVITVVGIALVAYARWKDHKDGVK
jgi:lysozyme